MFMTKNATKAVSVLKALGTAALCALALCFSKESAQGVKSGVALCLNMLVPSLFPFMTIASFITESSLAEKIGKPLQKPVKALFGLGGEFASAILLSLVGGYPVGAKAISALRKSGKSNNEACARAALFAVCSGPGFLVNYVGLSLYSSVESGFVLLFAQYLSVILTGIGLKFFFRNKTIADKPNRNPDTQMNRRQTGTGDIFVASVLSGAKAMFSICAFVVLFSAFTGTVSSLIRDENVRAAVFTLTEVCSAVKLMSGSMPIEAAAFAAGFGGLCVHFQIFSALGGVRVRKGLFFACRIVQGLLSAFAVWLWFLLFPETECVFSTSTVTNAEFFGGTALSGAALLVTAVCFIYSLKSCKQD